MIKYSKFIVAISAAFFALALISNSSILGNNVHSRPVIAAQAQSDINQSLWSPPINISQSGAASQPRIVASPDGRLQVFWFDRFDGLTTSYYDGSSWSKPQVSLLPSQQNIITIEFITDRNGLVHVFWQEQTTGKLLNNSLFHSSMPIGGTIWAPAELLAEDALVYDINASTDGGLNLAYIRRLKNENAEPGIYHRRMDGNTSSWAAANAIYRSVYYRLLNPGDSSIEVSDDGEGNIFAAWIDPFISESIYSVSNDKGQNWAQPAPINLSDQSSNHRLAAMPGFSIDIWQSPGTGNCQLFQHDWSYPPVVAPPSSEATLTPALSQSLTPIGWSNPQPILPGLSNCPSGEQFWPQPPESRMYWLWGEGSGSLSLTAWDTAKGQWADPVNFNFNFEDPQSAKFITLSDLHAAQSENLLAVAGTDAYSEVWVTIAKGSFDNFLYSPPPPWNISERVTPVDEFAIDPNLVIDGTGRSHLAWVQPSTAGILGASLMYSYWEPTSDQTDQLLAHSIDLSPSIANDIARNPVLFVNRYDDTLHLVWSGGKQGEILYKRAPVEKASSLNEWLSTQTLSTSPYANWPQIGIDALQRIYVVYAVSFNEDRGIYLTISQDRGQTWAAAEKIFDAAKAGLQSIVQPTLAVSPDGTLYLAWVDIATAGNNLPQAIYFSMSKDAGLNWIDPIVVAGPGYSMPKLIESSGQLLLFYAQGDDKAGNVWYRQAPISNLATEQESSWGPASRLQGWEQVNLPYGVAADGDSTQGTIYAIASLQIPGSFIYSTWKDNAWNQPEIFSSSMTNTVGKGVTIATRPEGGYLGMAWLAENSINQASAKQSSILDTGETLNFAVRTIPMVEVQAQPTITPTSTLAPTITPVVTMPVPTKTIDLNTAPPPNSSSSLPMIGGVLLSAALVVSIFAVRFIRNKR